jgi:hypothetical protein
MEAQTAKYDAALKKSNAELNKFRKGTGSALTKMQKQFNAFGKAVLGFASVYVGARGLGAIVRNTIEAEKSFAQLEAAVKSTGGVAGFSAPQLAEMATALQRVSTFGDEAIQSMQAVLLTFTRVRGPEFKGAQQAILDISARLGTDLKSAALQVGKALNDPIAGLGSLSRAGIQFSNDQKKAIKALVDTGKTAEAQRIILKELETQFGGSARAARNTLGGALTALQNSFGDLLEAKTGVPGVTRAINSLVDVLNDPKTIQGFNNFLGFMAGAAEGAIDLALRFGDFVQKVDDFLQRDILSDLANMQDKLESGPSLLDRLTGLDEDQIRQNIARIQQLIRENFPEGMTASGQFAGGRSGPQNSRRNAARQLEAPIVPPDSEAVRKALDAVDQELRQSIQIRNDLIRSTSAIAVPTEFMQFQLEMTKTLIDQGQSALDELERGAAKAEAQFNGSVGEMSVFAEQAARNLQDAFADFLFDPFSDGLRGMLKGFSDILRRMIAEAAAAKIFEALGGIGGIGGFLGGLFGGSAPARARGGPVTKGKFYTVGEKGPELFAAGSTGRIIPNGGGGGMTVAPVYNIDARGATQELVRALPGILAENNRRIVESMQQAMSRSGMRAPVF